MSLHSMTKAHDTSPRPGAWSDAGGARERAIRVGRPVAHDHSRILAESHEDPVERKRRAKAVSVRADVRGDNEAVLGLDEFDDLTERAFLGRETSRAVPPACPRLPSECFRSDSPLEKIVELKNEGRSWPFVRMRGASIFRTNPAARFSAASPSTCSALSPRIDTNTRTERKVGHQSDIGHGQRIRRARREAHSPRSD